MKRIKNKTLINGKPTFRNWKKGICSDMLGLLPILVVVATVAALLQMISVNIQIYGSFLRGSSGILANLLIFVVSLLFYFIIFVAIYRWLYQANTVAASSQIKGTSRIYYLLILIAGWLPWIIAFYPGSLFYDMSYQYTQYYGDTGLHLHPPFSTLLMGKLMDVGRNVFGSDNVGCFLYILLQTAVCAYACSEVMLFLYHLGTSKRVRAVLLLFYAFFPLFGSTMQMGAKDILNYGLILLVGVYTTQLYLFAYNDHSKWRKHEGVLCKYIIVSFFSCLFRKEMMYVYIFVTVMLLIIYVARKKQKIRCAMLVGGIVVFSLSGIVQTEVIAKGIMGSAFDEGDSEGLSIPLMQVARFVYYDGNKVEQWEKDILNECFYYGYDEITNNYNPNISDSIKYNFDYTRSKEAGFNKVYWSFFKKDPMMYIESVIASSYGYYSIVSNVPTALNDAPTNGLPGARLPVTYINLDPFDLYAKNIRLDIHYLDQTENLRTALRKWLGELQESLNFAFGYGGYTWLVVLMCLYSVYKERTLFSATPYLLGILLILVCIASPVNDYHRYYMGVIFLAPLMVGFTATVTKAYNVTDNDMHEGVL